jgi:hypothetical protein
MVGEAVGSISVAELHPTHRRNKFGNGEMLMLMYRRLIFS